MPNNITIPFEPRFFENLPHGYLHDEPQLNHPHLAASRKQTYGDWAHKLSGKLGENNRMLEIANFVWDLRRLSVLDSAEECCRVECFLRLPGFWELFLTWWKKNREDYIKTNNIDEDDQDKINALHFIPLAQVCADAECWLEDGKGSYDPWRQFKFGAGDKCKTLGLLSPESFRHLMQRAMFGGQPYI